MLEKLIKMKENYMKNTENIKQDELEDDLLPNYNFDFSKSKPNRFAARLKNRDNYILLEPDIAKYFKTSEQVNIALRAILLAYPSNKKSVAV